MNPIWESIEKYNDVINDIIWSKIGIWLLLFSGIYFTIITRGFQVLCTSLAATIGVGNIAGVSAAITTGGRNDDDTEYDRCAYTVAAGA